MDSLFKMPGEPAKKAVKRSHNGEMKSQTIDKNMLDFGEMAAMLTAMAATPQLEDFGGEEIPECCQEQIRLLLDDQLNGDEGKTLKDCCTGIWSGFRRYGFRWYKFRLYRQEYDECHKKILSIINEEDESDEDMDFEYVEGIVFKSVIKSIIIVYSFLFWITLETDLFMRRII